MQEMAAAYKGPHHVTLRQSEINFGTALHVSAVAKLAGGELIVMAAGDDVSLPMRTEMLASAWLRSGKNALLIHSKLFAISQGNAEEIRHGQFRVSPHTTLNVGWYLKNRSMTVLAPTCAYSRDLFDRFPPLIGGSLIEDGPMEFRAFMMGAFLAVDEYLVEQKILPESAGRGYRISDPNRWNAFLRSRIISYATQLRDLSWCDKPSRSQKERLSRYFVDCIQRLSVFFVSPGQADSLLFRLRFSARLIFGYPYSFRTTILDRIYFAIVMNEFDDVQFVQRLREIVSKVRKRSRT